MKEKLIDLNKTEQDPSKKTMISDIIGIGKRTFGFGKNKVKHDPLF
jgi:hypothetical protein